MPKPRSASKTQKGQYCPICHGKSVVKKGYESGKYYAICKNGCCVTKYAPTEAEAMSLWNSGKMFLTLQEKLRCERFPKIAASN